MVNRLRRSRKRWAHGANLFFQELFCRLFGAVVHRVEEDASMATNTNETVTADQSLTRNRAARAKLARTVCPWSKKLRR